MANASQPTTKKPLCFVVGPIGKDASAERRHSDLLLNAVIKHVLQSDEFGYAVKRADEDADPGMIGDRVVTDIINADLVLADLTDLNPNAFYELGIRHSTEKPTIHIAKMGTVLPFDNVAHRTIFVDLTDWHSIEQARHHLAESARTIQAPDYRVSNPITQANASFKMRQSEDPRDRFVAEMQERLSQIESALSKTQKPVAPELRVEDREALKILDKFRLIANTMRGQGASDKSILKALDDHSLSEIARIKNFRLDPSKLFVDINGILWMAEINGQNHAVNVKG